MAANAYLVQYGRLAFVGRFGAAVRDFARGDRVVIRGPRGLELGTVLCEASERFRNSPDDDGELIRPAFIEDYAAAERHEALGQKILAATEETGQSISFIDIEVSLDG